MPNRTTRDYEGPSVAPRVQAAIDAALQVRKQGHTAHIPSGEQQYNCHFWLAVMILGVGDIEINRIYVFMVNSSTSSFVNCAYLGYFIISEQSLHN